MPLLPAEPAQLHATAHRIRTHAADLRHRAVMLAGSADRTRWQSPAATAFRARVDEVCGRMRLAAHRLDSSADALDRHARAVGRTVHTVEHAVAGAVRALI